MKVWARRRGLVDAALGVSLAASPWLYDGGWEARSITNAYLAGILLASAALWALAAEGSRGARLTRAAVAVWMLASPLALGFADRPAALATWTVGVLALASAETVGLLSGLAASARTVYLRYQANTLTPAYVARSSGPEKSMGPENLARRIIDSADQIRRTLLARPSDSEVEICALGYRTCAENMITLVGLIDAEMERANPIRRLRLRSALRRASRAISLAHEAFPVALGITHSTSK